MIYKVLIGAFFICLGYACRWLEESRDNTKSKPSKRYQGRPMRSVVCAANKYGDLVFTGVRHFCPVMQFNMRGYDIHGLRRTRGEIQGFIDQHGVFMDRKEAAIVARDSGQLARYGDVLPSVLFSEDLY